MGLDPVFYSEPLRRQTAHVFAVNTLSYAMDSDIAWWNPADHNDPIPFRPDRAFARPISPYVAFSNTAIQSMQDAALFGGALTLWWIDAAGTEMYEAKYFPFEFPTVPVPYADGLAARASGLKWKVSASSPGALITLEIGNPCVMEWDFSTADQTDLQALPLPFI